MTEHIERDGETGRAVVASTGTPVDDILTALEEGGAFDAVLRRHPELTPEAVAAALHFARVAVGREIRYHPDPDKDRGFTGVRERALVSYGSGSARRGATVTINAGEYDDLVYRVDLLEGIFEAERELDEGNGIPHEQVMATLRHKFGG
jgi:uncharacterized protein (DUF433 family)